MVEQYDVVVLGSGPAGGRVARVCKKAGLSVMVVENYGFGGTCPLRGCEPKKNLVEAATALARFRDMTGQGLEGEARIDWAELMGFNRSLIDPISDKVETSFDYAGIESRFGRATFTGARTVEVDGEMLEGRHVVIATGAEPTPLNMAGKELVSSSDVFLEMKTMPSKIVFIGGGFISFELGHLAARTGADVTILEVFDRPLAPFDPDLVNILVQGTRKLGICVKMGSPVVSVDKKDGRLVVYAGEDGGQTYEADMVVHGAGRIPAVRELNLEKAGVEYSRKGVEVNAYLQSVSNPAVYAAGDVTTSPMALTPVATLEADVVAHNIIHGNEKKIAVKGIPSAVFTYPPLAALGMKEYDAEQSGLKYKKIFQETDGWSEHKRIGLKHAGFKLLIDENNDRLLGAHILGDRAEEVINIFALAIQHDLPLETFRKTIWAYPSSVYNTRYMNF